MTPPHPPPPGGLLAIELPTWPFFWLDATDNPNPIIGLAWSIRLVESTRLVVLISLNNTTRPVDPTSLVAHHRFPLR